MRKQLYYCLFLFFGLSLTVHAQENRSSLNNAKVLKGSVMVGGGGSGTFKKITESASWGNYSTKQLQLDLNAKAGYFIQHDFAVGLQLQGTYQTNYSEDQPRYTDAYVLGGPFARFYLYDGLFTEGSALFGKTHTTYRDRRNLMEFKAGLGYSFFINNKVAVEPALMFRYFQDRTPLQDIKTTEFGPVLSLGIQVFLFDERRFSFR